MTVHNSYLAHIDAKVEVEENTHIYVGWNIADFTSEDGNGNVIAAGASLVVQIREPFKADVVIPLKSLVQNAINTAVREGAND